MNKTIAIVAAFMAAALLALIPVSGVDGAYHSIEGEKTVIAVDEDADFTIIYTDSDHTTMDIMFSAKLVDSKGNTVTGAVSPSVGDVDSGVPTILTVTAPQDAGTYTLEVTYTGTVTEGEEEKDIDPVTDTLVIKAVKPITLTTQVSLKDPNVDLSGYGVYFWVDGQKMDDSYTTFSVSNKGTGSVSYDWIADAAKGKHTFWVESANGGVVNVDGLDKKHDFYVGDNDYTWYIVLAVLFVIIMIIVLVWVYRKPVKNFGKPKSRR
ncbi:MAG: hypothetical protein IKP20_01510 [Candidatus Methanomethylophilaceae archaeon]|jgi:hypothetical protein|nr:hypothetical protein [Candidatus Methanomethylophilaceae archaeon]